MHKTTSCKVDQKLAVDIAMLQAMTGSGRHTAERIGREAGAVMQIGRRKLYNVKKIEEYLSILAEGTVQQ